MKRVMILILLLFSCTTGLFAQGGGTCADFDGDGDYLHLGDYFQYTADFSIEMWVYADDWTPTSRQKIISCTQSLQGFSIFLDDDERLVFRIGDNSTWGECELSTSDFTYGWHHIAVTYDEDSDMDLWVDGTLHNDGPGHDINYYSGNSTIIGAEAGTDATPTGEYFNGSINEIRIWNIELSQSQIETWMHKPITSSHAPANVGNLRGYYKLDTDWPEGWLDDCSEDVGGLSTQRDLTNYNCSTLSMNSNMGDFPANYNNIAKCLWNKHDSEWADESDGLSLQSRYADMLHLDFVAYASNSTAGISTADCPNGVDERAENIWFLDDRDDLAEGVHMLFNCSEFEPDFFKTGLSQFSYRLLQRTSTSGDFTDLGYASNVTNGTVRFDDIGLNDDAYYTIGKNVNNPDVFTNSVSNIDRTTADTGGDVTSDGYGTVTARGICWNTSPPTLADDYTTDGTGTGTFTSSLSGLSPGTTYYVRAYATNGNGTDYGSNRTFTTASNATFEDGSGFNPSPTTGQINQPFGRFTLSGEGEDNYLNGVTILLEGSRTGAGNFKLWSSTDDSFDDASDTQLGSTVSIDPGEGNSVNFSGNLSYLSSSTVYYFVTCDLASDASGVILGYLTEDTDLSFFAPTSVSISNSPLSGSDVSLPVELSSFSAIAGNNKLTLNWMTASEIDNEAFILQRSTDNEVFELLAEIDGAGSTSKESHYTFTDNAVFNGVTYYYRLADRDVNGVITYHTTVNATPNAAGIDIVLTGLVVNDFALHSNYPNPFNPETTVRFDIPTAAGDLKHIRLSVYNALGQLVSTLYEGELSGGQYEMKWNGVGQPSGLYFVSFQSEQFVETRKMVLLR